MSDKKYSITTIGTIVLFLVAYIGFAIVLMDTIKAQKLQIEVLDKDNTQLESDLTDRDNQIYELTLELKTTEKALAETAYELEQLAIAQDAVDNINLEYIGEYKCTAYCCEKYAHICGTGSGKTASGAPLTADISVAVTDLKKMPYGTIIYIEDVGIRIVQDTGSFPKNQIDVAVDTHKHAQHWEGQGKHKVYIIKLNEEEAN